MLLNNERIQLVYNKVVHGNSVDVMLKCIITPHFSVIGIGKGKVTYLVLTRETSPLNVGEE
jgi:hypothetical protein